MKTISDLLLSPPPGTTNWMEDKLRHLFDSTLDMICSTNAKGEFVYVSGASLHILGYSPQELLGTSCLELVLEEDRERTIESKKEIVNGRKFTNFQNRMVHKNGNIVPILWSSRWDSETESIMAIAREATDILETQALQEKHRLDIEEILERITDAFFAMDDQFNIVWGNRVVEKMLNINRDDYIGKNFWDCFPDMVGSEYYIQYHKAMAEKVTVHFDAWFGPFEKWLEVHAYPSETGLSVFFSDITDVRKSRLELERLSLIARETSNSVVILETDNTISWVNQAFTRFSGYSFEEAVGKKPGDLLDGPLTDKNTVEYIRRQQMAGAPYHAEVLNYRKDGETYWVEVHGQPHFNQNGNLEQYFSIETDITARKKLEGELEEQRKKFNYAVISAGERERTVVGQELHDNVNQVLTTVKLYLELCRDGIGPLEETLDKSIKLMQDSINEIRLLSRQLSAPSLGKIKLKDSIRELIESIRYTNRIEVDLDIDATEGLDLTRELHLGIYRIIQEHLTNVLKHSMAEKVSLRFKTCESKICLNITDTGKGFDITAARNGIGIDSMISRAESLNGKLAIETSPGKGCTLKLCVPLRLEKSPT